MALSPQITLTATLMDFSGNAIGTATNPAYLRIKLCGFGQSLPLVGGTGMIGKVASEPVNVAYVGSQVTVMLFGNDVITPANTFYEISVIDTNLNVIQSGIYQFAGTETVDLSNATQIVQPILSPPIAGLNSFSQTMTVSGNVFTLPYTPQSGTPLFLFRSGMFMTVGVDYTIASATVTFTLGYEIGDVISGFVWAV